MSIPFPSMRRHSCGLFGAKGSRLCCRAAKALAKQAPVRFNKQGNLYVIWNATRDARASSDMLGGRAHAHARLEEVLMPG